MKKTLLIAAAALAAGVISSQAQAVYSQNIVGYVNTPLPVGYAAINNPLDASGANNSVTNSINVFSGNYDGSTLSFWNGHGYTVYTIDSGQPTGIGNASDTAPVAPPNLPPGTTIFLNNTTGAPQTNSFVGTVHVDGAATGTNTIGFTTNTIPVGLTFIASELPIGGGVSSVLQLPVPSGNLDGSLVYIPIISGGLVHGYSVFTIDSGQPSGFGNATDTAPATEPVIPVGGGFFINNTTGATQTWVQSL